MPDNLRDRGYSSSWDEYELKQIQKQATYKSNGSTSNIKAQNIELNRIKVLQNCGYEATVEIKGNLNVFPNNYINLQIYCEDGTLHFASGKYKVLERTDSIEGSFLTTLRLLKESGDIVEVNGNVIVDGKSVNTSYRGTGTSVSSASYGYEVAGGEYAPGQLLYTGVYRTNMLYGCTVPIISGYGTGQNLINIGMKYLGTPYVWGGSSLTKGCDCSHFVWLVAKESGRDYGYHIANNWRNIGQEVQTTEVEPGDVICYNGHVAFYLDSSHILHSGKSNAGPSMINVRECEPFKICGGAITIRRIV